MNFRVSHARLLVFWGGVQLGMNGFDHNPVEYAAHVECPTPLLHGERGRVTVSEIRSIYERLAGTKDLIFVSSDAGHESYLKVDPERWRAAIREFCTNSSTRQAGKDNPAAPGRVP